MPGNVCKIPCSLQHTERTWVDSNLLRVAFELWHLSEKPENCIYYCTGSTHLMHETRCSHWDNVTQHTSVTSPIASTNWSQFSISIVLYQFCFQNILKQYATIEIEKGGRFCKDVKSLGHCITLQQARSSQVIACVTASFKTGLWVEAQWRRLHEW